MSFDPVQYKTTTRQQWEDAADAWHRWGPTLETRLAEFETRDGFVGPCKMLLAPASK